MHDADFRASEKDWHSFVEKLTERLIEIDDTVPELPVKDIVSLSNTSGAARTWLITYVVLQVFRIYRDIRFSSDPTPYKVSTSKPGRQPASSPPASHLVTNARA